MAITTVDLYQGAQKQRIKLMKTATRTTVAAIPFNLFELAGMPGAGTLAGTNTANGGTVQTDATTGFPVINFTSGTGYLTKVEFGNTVASRLNLYDMVVKMGAISYAAGTTTCTGQPDISSRCPDYPGSGTTFGAGMELWCEVTTAFATGNNWQVQVTYTNSAGTAGIS